MNFGRAILENFNNVKKNHPIQKRAKDLNKHLAQEDTQITSKYVKRCSPLPVNEEMQTKSPLSYQLAPRRMAMLKKREKHKCW